MNLIYYALAYYDIVLFISIIIGLLGFIGYDLIKTRKKLDELKIDKIINENDLMGEKNRLNILDKKLERLHKECNNLPEEFLIKEELYLTRNLAELRQKNNDWLLLYKEYTSQINHDVHRQVNDSLKTHQEKWLVNLTDIVETYADTVKNVILPKINSNIDNILKTYFTYDELLMEICEKHICHATLDSAGMLCTISMVLVERLNETSTGVEFLQKNGLSAHKLVQIIKKKHVSMHYSDLEISLEEEKIVNELTELLGKMNPTLVDFLDFKNTNLIGSGSKLLLT